MAEPLTPLEFQRTSDVSRETLDKLTAYVDLLRKWQRSINLVSAPSLADVWRRHILDSAQLIRLAPSGRRSWLDLGSGAGLPGLVVAILGMPNVHLVESDRRKCAFLREAVRITDVVATIHNCRIDTMTSCPHDVISARALAPLPALLELVARFMGSESVALLPKGQDVATELTEAAKYWRMKVETLPSLTDRRAAVLKITELSRV